MTVFGSRCFDVIRTCWYMRPDSNARVVAVRRRSCGQTSFAEPSAAPHTGRVAIGTAAPDTKRAPPRGAKGRATAGHTAPVTASAAPAATRQDLLII